MYSGNWSVAEVFAHCSMPKGKLRSLKYITCRFFLKSLYVVSELILKCEK